MYVDMIPNESKTFTQMSLNIFINILKNDYNKTKICQSTIWSKPSVEHLVSSATNKYPFSNFLRGYPDQNRF